MTGNKRLAITQISRVVRPSALITAAALLVVGLAGLYLPTWAPSMLAWMRPLSLDAPAWRWLRPMQAYAPWNNPWFWPSAVTVMTAVILGAVARPLRAAIFGERLTVAAVPRIDGRIFSKTSTRLAGAVVLGGTSVLIVAAGSQRPLPAWAWSVALGGIVGWAWFEDRTSPRPRTLGSDREWLCFAWTLAHLFMLGWIYRSPAVRCWGLAASLLLHGGLWWWRPAQARFWMLQLLLAVSVLYYVVDAFSWRYSFIGDEYSFYDLARLLQQPGNPARYLEPLGVYHINPMAASFHQSWVDRIFGSDIYGWRMSGVLAVHAAALFFYVFLRELLGGRAALFGCALFLASHRFVAMTLAGYNQMQGLTALTWFWALAALALGRGSYLGYVLCGVAAAAGFYTFPLVVPLAALGGSFLLMAGRIPEANERGAPTGAFSFAPLALFCLGLLVAVLPRLLQTDAIVEQALLGSASDLPSSLNRSVGFSWLVTAVSVLGINYYTHYSSGPLLDPLSAALVLGGSIYVMAYGWRSRLGRWLMVATFLQVLIVGGLNNHDTPPNTRLFLLIPVYLIFGAILFCELEDVLLRSRRGRVLCGGLGVLVVAGLFGINYAQLHYVLDQVYPREPYQYAVRAFEDSSPDRVIYLITNKPNGHDSYLDMIIEAHGWDLGRRRYVPWENPAASLEEITRTNPSAWICVSPALSNFEEWRRAARNYPAVWREVLLMVKLVPVAEH